MLQQYAGKSLSFPSPISGYNTNVQPTAPSLPCFLGKQQFSWDGWSITHRCNELQAMARCQGTPLTWCSHPISVHPFSLRFVNLLSGNRGASKMVSNLAIRKGNPTFKSLRGK